VWGLIHIDIFYYIYTIVVYNNLYNFMYETVGERIKVAAVFEKGEVRPLVFSWNNVKQKVKCINLIHSAFEGSAKCLFFSLSTDKGEYKIKYNTQDLNWTLEQIYLEG